MELGVRVNAGSDREVDDEPREGMERPSVNVHGLPQAYVMPNSDNFSVDSIDPTDTEQVGAESRFARRSRPLPLPRTSRAALRPPCESRWVLLPPSAGCIYGLDSLLHAEEACRIFNRARDAMAGIDEVPEALARLLR